MNTRGNTDKIVTIELVSQQRQTLVMTNQNNSIIQQLNSQVNEQNSDNAELKKIANSLKSTIEDQKRIITRQSRAMGQYKSVICAQKETIDEQTKTLQANNLALGVRESMFEAQHQQSEELIALLETSNSYNQMLAAKIVEQQAVIEELKNKRLQEINNANRLFNCNQPLQIGQSHFIDNNTPQIMPAIDLSQQSSLSRKNTPQ